MGNVLYTRNNDEHITRVTGQIYEQVFVPSLTAITVFLCGGDRVARWRKGNVHVARNIRENLEMG